jgi:hypothetical protein
MSTLHQEARLHYKKLQKRHKLQADPYDFITLRLMAKMMKLIPEFKEGGLHPLHRKLILCFQASIRSERRDKAEMNAFRKIQDIVTADNVELLARFYRLPIPKNDVYVEYLSSRVRGVDTLMNGYVRQLELAEAYFEANPSAGRRAKPAHEETPEPEGWKARAPGALGEKSWDRVCIEYPDYAKQLANGEDLT